MNPVKFYKNVDADKIKILSDNKGKSGIYLFINLVNNKIYIGSAINLYKRFYNYYNTNYLKKGNSMAIYKALLKYGYFNFSLAILEYCELSYLILREQYFIDLLNPEYNILKIAGSSLARKQTE